MTESISAFRPPSSNEPRLRWLTFLVAGVLFMEFLDGTVIITALPAMGLSFGRSAIDLNLGVSAYLFALGVFIPVSGWMAERFGARRVFVAAIAIFTIASLLCGLAGNFAEFVVTRVLQGFGGAMMVPVGRQVVLEGTPKEKLISAMSILVWPALVAPIIGPSLGGFIATYGNWRWIFFLNIPLGLLALLAALRLVPEGRRNAERHFDWMGFILCALGILSFLYCAEMLSVADADVVPALAALALSIGFLTGAFFHMKRQRTPMLDIGAFAIPTFAAALRGGSCTRAAVGSAPFLLPLMFQIGFGWSAVKAGLVVMAVFAGNLLMKSATTPLLKKFGFRPILLWNGILCALSLLACAFLAPDTPLALTALILFLGGLVRSLQFTAISTVAFADIPQDRVGAVNALFSTVFQLSLGAGVTVGALAVRLGEVMASGATDSAAAYRWAFVLVAALVLLGVMEASRLEPGSGDHLAKPRT